jgi:hypothetical protein
MEAELLAGVLQTDTHKRLQNVEQLIEHFKKEDVFDDFSDLERLVGGLSSWIGSSNFRVRYALQSMLGINLSRWSSPQQRCSFSFPGFC